MQRWTSRDGEDGDVGDGEGMLPIACCLLHVACCMLHVACSHVAASKRATQSTILRSRLSQPRCARTSTQSSSDCRLLTLVQTSARYARTLFLCGQPQPRPQGQGRERGSCSAQVLFLDCTAQSCEADEFVYHEVLAHPVMLMASSPKYANQPL